MISQICNQYPRFWKGFGEHLKKVFVNVKYLEISIISIIVIEICQNSYYTNNGIARSERIESE